MTNLKQVLSELRETIKQSKTNPKDGDPRTFQGREMLCKQAENALPALKRKALESLKESSFVVFIQGPGAAKTLELAKENAETIHVDVGQMFGALVDRVEATIPPSRQFGLNSFFVLQDILDTSQFELGLEPQDLTFIDTVVLPTKQDTRNLVSQYINKFIGNTFLTCAITNSAVLKAVELAGDSAVIPVFVEGLSEVESDKIAKDVLSGKSVFFDAKEDVSEKEVIKLFGEIKKSFKKQKDS